MTFSDAVSMIGNGGACKRPAWTGYVKKVVTDDTNGYFKLFFVKREGTFSNSTNTGTALAGEYLVAGNPPAAVGTPSDVMKGIDIIVGMTQNDWTTGLATEFEAARSGSGTW